MKKKLLSESQVRRFMGLAGIQPINEMSHYKTDDEMHENTIMEEEDMEMDVEVEDEAPEMKDEGGEADVEIDEEDLGDIKSALDTLQSKLAPLLDQAEGGEDMDMGDEEPDMDMDMGGDEEGGDLDAELEDVDMEPTPEEIEEQQEQIVNEVARRVAKRIVEAKRAHQKMNEALGRKTVKGARPKLRRR